MECCQKDALLHTTACQKHTVDNKTVGGSKRNKEKPWKKKNKSQKASPSLLQKLPKPHTDGNNPYAFTSSHTLCY